MLEETLIVGLGNILLGDEGVGVHILNRLKKVNTFPNTQYLDLGTSSYELINFMNPGVHKIVLIDCILARDANPGQVITLSAGDIVSEVDYKLSLHQIKLIDTLKLISIEYNFPDTLIIGIVPFDMHSFSTNLSAKLQERFIPILNTVVQYIDDFIKNTK
jgi:hydrogenase maturation protease